MGDRATVQVVSGDEFSPLAYLHWLGEGTLPAILEAAPRMRQADVNYAFARLCGQLNNEVDGALSFGVSNIDAIIEEDITGDAGHYKVDLIAKTVTNYPSGIVATNLEFYQL